MPNSESIAFYNREDAADLNRRWLSFGRAETNAPVLPDIEKAIMEARAIGREPKVLCIGEGTGVDATKIFTDIFHVPVVAVDASENLLEWSQKNASNPNIEYVHDTWPDLKKIFARNEQYDVVFSSATLQELKPEEHEAAIRSAVQLTKPGGATVLIWPTPPTRAHHSVPDLEILQKTLKNMNHCPEEERLRFSFGKLPDVTNRLALNGEPVMRAYLIIHVPIERKINCESVPSHLPPDYQSRDVHQKSR